jgi:hypothetical protein
MDAEFGITACREFILISRPLPKTGHYGAPGFFVYTLLTFNAMSLLSDLYFALV